MGRSGYTEDGDCDNNAYLLWPSIVRRSLTGKRGQAFLRELAAAMDAMPVKELIAGELVTPEGACCTMGVVCKARGLDVCEVDDDDQEAVAKLLGIAPTMAREIAFLNDDDFQYEKDESPARRWERMRTWVGEQLRAGGTR